MISLPEAPEGTAQVVPALGSVQREVVGAAVPAGGRLLPLHQQVVEQAGGADPEPFRFQPVVTDCLVYENK